MTIDATTQPGFTVAPIVRSNGAGAGGAAVDGIRFTGDGLSGQQIRGLVVNHFSGNGIVILDAVQSVISVAAPSTRVQGNLIGLNAAGSAAVPNGMDGVAFTAGTAHSVGGSTSGFRNVIAGNVRHGISLASGVTSATINSNTISLDALGTARIPNGGSGIFLAAGADTTTIGVNGGIGVSGNTRSGLDLRSNGSTVRNNRLGTDFSGTAGLGNGGDDITIQGSNN